MEIDAKFPSFQASQSRNARAGEPQTPPLALVESGSEFYISPVLRFDSRSLTLIFEVRDSNSGDVVRQFPPETVVERYRQDPTLKPFVVSPAQDDGASVDDAEEIDLGPFLGERDGEGAGDPARPDSARPDPASSVVSGVSQAEPVNLVA